MVEMCSFGNFLFLRETVFTRIAGNFSGGRNSDTSVRYVDKGSGTETVPELAGEDARATSEIKFGSPEGRFKSSKFQAKLQGEKRNRCRPVFSHRTCQGLSRLYPLSWNYIVCPKLGGSRKPFCHPLDRGMRGSICNGISLCAEIRMTANQMRKSLLRHAG